MQIVDWKERLSYGKRYNDDSLKLQGRAMKPVLVLRHVRHEGLGTIADALAQQQVAYEIADVLTEPPHGFDPQQLSGLIVMGGPMNADDTQRYPFLQTEVDWLRRAVDANLPVLGVCLGAQLLAKALGARVYANHVKEIGWYEVELLPAAADDPLFCDAPRPATVFHWHGDTFDLPQGAVQLARGEQCENQAYRFGSTVYGLQFHIEVTAAMIEDWFCQSVNCGELADLDYIDPAAIRREVPRKLPRMERLAREVFGRFAAMCRMRLET